MTGDERESVVEVLRCAADLVLQGCVTPLCVATDGVDESIAYGAIDAEGSVWRSKSRPYSRAEVLLEAARRVEEGTWPPR